MNEFLTNMAGVIAAATPWWWAVIGETFSERSGVINLCCQWFNRAGSP